MIGLARVEDVLTMMSADLTDSLDDLYTVQDVLDQKRQSPSYPALLKVIQQDGITVPVLIRTLDGTPWLVDGHHRVTAAIDLGLTMVPWTDVPLDVDSYLMNPQMRAPWGPYSRSAIPR